jgi:hypothetical protein
MPVQNFRLPDPLANRIVQVAEKQRYRDGQGTARAFHRRRDHALRAYQRRSQGQRGEGDSE